MTDFTASNGTKVDVYTKSLSLETSGDAQDWIEPWAVDALREFFQHERDEELGRWRFMDSDGASYLVYPTDSDAVHVVRELDGAGFRWSEDDAVPMAKRGGAGGVVKAAAAYFAIQRPSKPWEDAKPGELWALTRAGSGTDVWRREQYEWRIVAPGSTGSVSPASAIKADSGHRIWPEESS